MSPPSATIHASLRGKKKRKKKRKDEGMEGGSVQQGKEEGGRENELEKWLRGNSNRATCVQTERVVLHNRALDMDALQVPELGQPVKKLKLDTCFCLQDGDS